MEVLKLIAMAVAAVLVVGVGLIAVVYWRFFGEMGNDIARLVAEAKPSPGIVTEEMLAGLPSPAQRYFRTAGILGKPIPKLIRLTQSGRIRGSADASWMTFEADETYSTEPAAFVWRVHLPTRLLPMVLGRDEYLDGNGSILIKAAALVPVADERGDTLKAAGLMRYLNEMMWFPAALLGRNVAISAIDEGSFGVALTDRCMTAEAQFFVDADGNPTNFRAQRYNTSTRSTETWETPISRHGALDGLKVPTAGAAVWKLATGDLTYIELQITSLSHED